MRFIGWFLLLLTIGAGAAAFYYKEQVLYTWDTAFTPNRPAAVANDYWLLMLSNEQSEAADLSMASEKHSKWISGFHPHDRAILGQEENQDGIYFIETQLVLYREKAHVISLYTVVNSINGKFKVDDAGTYNSFWDAAQADAIESYISSVKSASRLFKGASLSGSDLVSFQEVAAHNIKVQLCSMADELMANLTALDDSMIQTNTATMCQP